MIRKILLIFIPLLINGCGVSGHYRSEGPCKGFHKDQQACERAAANLDAIGKVAIGQTIEEVRLIMEKGPERREATKQTETWSYITSYAEYRYTTIIFEHGIVVGIK